MDGQRLPEQERGERHYDHRAAIVGERCNADANLLIGFIKKHPAGAHRNARQSQECRLPPVVEKREPLPGGYKKEGEKQATNTCAQQNDFIAGQRNATGDNAHG